MNFIAVKYNISIRLAFVNERIILFIKECFEMTIKLKLLTLVSVIFVGLVSLLAMTAHELQKIKQGFETYESVGVYAQTQVLKIAADTKLCISFNALHHVG